MAFTSNREDIIVYFAGLCNSMPLEIERSNREGVLIERMVYCGGYVRNTTIKMDGTEVVHNKNKVFHFMFGFYNLRDPS
jgi:hypothetical protein